MSDIDWRDHGFVRVAAAAPPVHLADPAANADELTAWAHRLAGDGAALVVFPELALTGYTCEDLFLTSDLLERTEAGLAALAGATAGLDSVIVVGRPGRRGGRQCRGCGGTRPASKWRSARLCRRRRCSGNGQAVHRRVRNSSR